MTRTLKPISVEQGKAGGELVPAKVYQAVCKNIFDLGYQKTPYTNQDGSAKIQHKIVIAWELNAKMTGGEYAGKRFNKTKKYTYSLFKSADGSKSSELYKDLVAWRGRDFTPAEAQSFDPYKIIGANCMLNIVHETGRDGKQYAKISSISPLYDGMPKMAIEDTSNEVPEWVQKIQKEQVYPESQETGAVSPEELSQIPQAVNEDEVPF